MAKINLILVLVGVVITVQGLPASYDEVLAAAAKEQLQAFSASETDSSELKLQAELDKEALKKPFVFDSVRNLKPVEGGHVFGQAEYAFHSASNINGKTKEDIGGHKIINNNGKIKEFDFTPSTIAPLGLLQFNSAGSNLKPILGTSFAGHDYSLPAGSTFHAKNPVYAGFKPQIQSIKTPSTAKFPLPLLPFSGVPADLKGSQLSPLVLSDIRDLKPGKDVHVYGEAEYTVHHTSNIDGKQIEDHHAGHKIINNDGKIKEFGFTPKPGYFPTAPLLLTDVRDLKPGKDVHVYGEAEYTVHHTSNVDGKKIEDHHAGHKIINNDGKIKEFAFTPKPGYSPTALQKFPLSILDKDIGELKTLFAG